MTYKMLDHTADVGLKVEATELTQVFAEAVEGLLGIVIEGEIKATDTIKIHLQAESIEELFHDWLSEINYQLTTHHKILRKFSFTTLTPTELNVNCSGEEFNSDRHQFNTEIKAVTYHQLYVKQQDDCWHAQVFFDL